MIRRTFSHNCLTGMRGKSHLRLLHALSPNGMFSTCAVCAVGLVPVHRPTVPLARRPLHHHTVCCGVSVCVYAVSYTHLTLPTKDCV